MILATGTLVAQKEKEGQFTKKGEFDPAAKAILDKLKAKYDTFLSLEVEVDLEIEIPESDKQSLSGKMIQSGDKYRMEWGDNVILSDGENLWTILKDAEEVQLSDAESPDGEDENILMSPKDLLNIYEKGDYVYAFTNEVLAKGKLIQHIEFKPIDKDSEYFKIRINVDKKGQLIESIKIFSKDGSRYTLTIKNIRTNKMYESKIFRYDDSICPGCRVEDLRF